MGRSQTSRTLSLFLAAMALFCLGSYFTFAAVQGDYGIFQRVQIEAEIEIFEKELISIETQISEMRNKTRRLSDQSLDLDLLDLQARDRLGLMRADEILIQ